MKNEPVHVKKVEHLAPDVLHIVVEKPEEANYTPGQATEVFIDKSGWQNEGRPFTFIGLPEADFLEFAIKTYPDHRGVTNELLNLKQGDTLILNDIFGAIEYKGVGTFMAGGAGVTPFIAILRELESKDQLANNTLLFANKTEKDIILHDEFRNMLHDNFVNILSEEEKENYPHGYISEEFIKKHAATMAGYFYVCGPPPMMDAVTEQLSNLGVAEERIITEAF